MQSRQYTTFELEQSNAAFNLAVWLLKWDLNSLHGFTKGQVSHPGLLQVFIPVRVLFSLFAGGGGTLAFTNLSLRFFALLKATIGVGVLCHDPPVSL